MVGDSGVSFVGRAEELARLQLVLDAAFGGTAATVVVSGEQGIGKTRLLEEFASEAESRGCLVLGGCAAEFELELPFGVFIDALDPYLRTLDEGTAGRLALDRLGELAVVFPALGHLRGSIEQPVSAAERFRVHYAVRDLLERLAVRRPVVLLLDDLHWADGASLELLQFLFRRPPDAPVVLCASKRVGTGVGLAGLDGAAALVHHADVTSVALGPLGIEEIEELIGRSGEVNVENLFHNSGGNPFYALQLAAVSDGSAVGNETGEVVPPAVAASIFAQLEALSPPTRNFAQSAAVVGDPFDLDLVAEVRGDSEESVWSHLDELVGTGLVRPTDVPRRFRFRHPLWRNAVYTSTAHGARAKDHRRVAAILAARGVAAELLACHVEQIAVFGDLGAVSVLQRAGDASSRHAPMIAARWYAAALRLLPGDAQADERRVTLLGSLAHAQAATGRFAEALAAIEEALELMAEAPIESRLELVVGCSEIEQLVGRHTEALTRLRREFGGLGAPCSPAVALLISMSSASLYLADHRGMLEWARRSVEVAEQLGDDVLLAAALAALANGAVFAGDGSLALTSHDEAAALVDGLGSNPSRSHLDALCSLATAELYMDRYVEGCRHGERALRLARATGTTQLLPILTPILGMSLAMTGQMAKSAEVLDDAIEAARIAGNAPGLAMNLFNRALAAVMSGDIDIALAAGAESVEVARSVDNGVITAFAGAIQAQAMFENGDPRRSRRLLLDSVGGAQIPLLAGGWRAHFLEVLTRCDLELGQVEDAAIAADRCRDLAEASGSSLAALMADRAQAEVALARGCPQTASEHALRAADRSERTGATVHAATSHALAGRAMAAGGHRADAVAQFEHAAAAFEAIGAPRYRDRADAELRKLGCVVHRRTRRGVTGESWFESLTGREREVAELIRERRTNREIAEELFLSTKTIESHVRSLFNKVGVSRRAEVARALDELLGASSARPPGSSPPAPH